MKKILVILVLVVMGCSTTPKVEEPASNLSGEKDCQVKGHSIQWEFSYCMNKTNINDKHSKTIQNCISGLDSSYGSKPECEKRYFLKKKMCELKVKRNQVQGGIYSCLNNKELDSAWIK